MNFKKLVTSVALGTIMALSPQSTKSETVETIIADEWQTLQSHNYGKVTHPKIQWKQISDGLQFSRTPIFNDGKHVDTIAAVKIDPKKNELKLFNGYSPKGSSTGTIEEWQKATGAEVLVNSAQYMGDPYYKPVALFVHNGKNIGPQFNYRGQAVLVGNPNNSNSSNSFNLPSIDLIDFTYDYKSGKRNNFHDLQTQYIKTKNKAIKQKYKKIYWNLKEQVIDNYSEAVVHWGILLDREGNIREPQKPWQANRTVVAKTWDKDILFMTTEGGYFTLHNLGKFFKESNKREDKGYNIHTAMNMDGGYEADMAISTSNTKYVTYGEFETYGPNNDATVHDWKIRIPGVITVSSKK